MKQHEEFTFSFSSLDPKWNSNELDGIQKSIDYSGMWIRAPDFSIILTSKFQFHLSIGKISDFQVGNGKKKYIFLVLFPYL